MTASTPLLITFGFYLLAMVAIGFIAWWRTRDFDDYILGGRSLGGYVTALSAGASDMSGWLLMGLPGALYLTGLSEAWIAVGLVIGAYLNWRFVAGPLRLYTERSADALTLPDYFTTRFGENGKLLRVVSALVILVFFALYAASGIVAGARLFESVFGLPYAQALWWGAAATIAYTLIGGFLAVSWTDTVQATLMIFALILTPIIVMAAVGGPTESLAMIERSDALKLSWVGKGGFIAVISALAWGLGYFGQPHILARFMAAESVKTIPQARRIGMTWMVLCLLGAILVGFFGISYFEAHPDQAGPVTANPERVFIVLAELLFNPWIAGVLLSAILAAVMSTLSCQLLVCASALTEDFYRGFVRPEAGERELVWFGRAMVALVALVAIFIARDPDSRVLGLVSYAWAGFGAAFGPVVLMSLFWRRMNGWGALAGIVAGAATVILWKQFAGSALYEIVPGFINRHAGGGRREPDDACALARSAGHA
ncbi:sodium/proline symporter PutP [Solilutibacter oculi]|uniref:sodium/proline symporter PutP n=1 Tax=Solilutibacter oculi TaxID=2698682 RepID=UPI001EFFCB2A|nr:sodium/proline symporter PutP [Lysobacter oculi]